MRFGEKLEVLEPETVRREMHRRASNLHGRFKAWKDSGLLEEILAKLSKECDIQDLSFDSTSCNVHQHVAGAKRGRKKPV